MSDNVVSLASGKSLDHEKVQAEIARKELEAAEEIAEQQIANAASEHKKSMLTVMDMIKDRIEKDEIEGFIFAGRNPGNGAFLSLTMLDEASTRCDTYLAYGGMAGALQVDMVDMAAAGPHMNPDGSYFASDIMSALDGVFDDD